MLWTNRRGYHSRNKCMIHLGTTRLTNRWVPRLNTISHKRNRVTTSKKYWTLFTYNPRMFHNGGRNTDSLSNTWAQVAVKTLSFLDESSPKKDKVGPSADKDMATYLGMSVL